MDLKKVEDCAQKQYVALNNLTLPTLQSKISSNANFVRYCFWKKKVHKASSKIWIYIIDNYRLSHKRSPIASILNFDISQYFTFDHLVDQEYFRFLRTGVFFGKYDLQKKGHISSFQFSQTYCSQSALTLQGAEGTLAENNNSAILG